MITILLLACAALVAVTAFWGKHKLEKRLDQRSGITWVLLWFASLFIGGICVPLAWEAAHWELTAVVFIMTEDALSAEMTDMTFSFIGLLLLLVWWGVHMLGWRSAWKAAAHVPDKQTWLISGTEWHKQKELGRRSIGSSVVKLLLAIVVWLAAMCMMQSLWRCLGACLVLTLALVCMLFWVMRLQVIRASK